MSYRILRASCLVVFAVSLAAGCDRPQPGFLSENPPNQAPESVGPAVDTAVSKEPLGEVVNDYPGDFERMVHVLTNLSRHAPINSCDDFTQLPANEDPLDPATKLAPLVYSPTANQAARFMCKHMAQNGCFQHDSCCVLGDTGSGVIGCTSGATCSGSTACQLECTGGTPIGQRYNLLGLTDWTGENIALGQPNAYEVWCAWMHSHGHRQNIYSSHTQLGVGLYNEPGGCGPYWTQSFASGSVTIPRIPVASAMYAPPNPRDATNVYFAANYYDSAGQAPKRAVVVVNGHCVDLTRQWGYDDNGTYETHFTAADDLPQGCQPYYFMFVDGNADRWTYPDTGSLQVAIGKDVTCPSRYDAAAQLPADCEGGSQDCQEGETQSCYTGPEGSEGNGECKAGIRECKNGFWTSCHGEITPKAEICDGMDNNCDGTIDEWNPGGNTSCMVSAERGECLAGARQCIAGALVCVSHNKPQTEVCDGLDNDCDGVIDDGFPVVSCGQGECFRMVATCKGGQTYTCEPGTPSAEVADGRDNDCDGQVDNGIDCRKPDGGVAPNRLCYSYPVTDPDGVSIPIISPCIRGTQSCNPNGEWGPCVGEIGPSVEVCDGKDNDCNGSTDDLDQLGWNRCGEGLCTQVSQACKLGKPNTCTPKPSAAEACDGKDNSCDGVIDEGCTCRTGMHFTCYSGPKYTLDAGTCHAGERSCNDGQWSGCEGEAAPATEYCDGQDENCNGIVDDNCLARPDAGHDAGTPQDEHDAGTIDAADAGSGGGGSQGCGCSAGAGAGAAGILPMLFFGLALVRRRREE